MKVNRYRDGGTRSFYDNSFDSYFKGDKIEICEDNRIGSLTKGQWYLGYPERGRLLTDTERVFCVEKIIAYLGKEYERAKYVYKAVLGANPDCTFEDDFQQYFSLSSSSVSGGNYKDIYKGKGGFSIVDENGLCTLKDENGILMGRSTLKECYAKYKEEL